MRDVAGVSEDRSGAPDLLFFTHFFLTTIGGVVVLRLDQLPVGRNHQIGTASVFSYDTGLVEGHSANSVFFKIHILILFPSVGQNGGTDGFGKLVPRNVGSCLQNRRR